MYDLTAKHLYPSTENCPACGQKLKEWYRKKGELIKTLQSEKYIVSHVYKCAKKKCTNAKTRIMPEEEGRIALKHCTIGLNVTIEIGKLRNKKNRTFEEIQFMLQDKFDLKISERKVGHQNQTYLTLLNMIMKKEKSKEWKALKKLKGLVLAIDGIQPDIGNKVLFMIREVQTGYILAAKMFATETENNYIKILCRKHYSDDKFKRCRGNYL